MSLCFPYLQWIAQCLTNLRGIITSSPYDDLGAFRSWIRTKKDMAIVAPPTNRILRLIQPIAGAEKKLFNNLNIQWVYEKVVKNA